MVVVINLKTTFELEGAVFNYNLSTINVFWKNPEVGPKLQVQRRLG